MSVHRIGFTELTGIDGIRNGPYQVNILFVHGLRGHPRHTWEEESRDVGSEGAGAATSSKRRAFKSFFKTKSSISTAENRTSESRCTKVFWPDEYLTQDIPEARIWTYGYNADVIGGLFQASNQNSVSQHARDLAVRVEREIENEDPIIFVVHSLGGIIVKDAISRSDTCRARTKSIIFLGTPHRGSAFAGWGEIASNLARLALQDSNKEIIKALEVNGEILDKIHEDFKTIADQTKIKIHSFQEAQGMSGMKGLHSKVVDDFSSKLDLPRRLETVESINANHRQMARCSNKADPRYRAIVGVLKQFMRGMAVDGDGTRPQEMLLVQTAATAVELDGVSLNRAAQPCYHLPFPKNKRFVGRDQTLDTLEQKFFTNECQKVAVTGLGGVGKTQVVLNFAYWAKENKPNYSIFWVSALSDASFEQSYSEMARKLPVRKDNDDKNLMQSVRRYLNSEAAGPWLLIVDNVDDKEVLFGSAEMPGGIIEYLPESEVGLTLFTTRSRKVAVDVAGNEVVELDKMSLQEAESYLEKSLIREGLPHDGAETIELLNELTYLPLAITQAAAYLNENQVSIAEYLRLLRGTEQDMIRLMSRTFYDNTRYRSSQNAVAMTWLVSFDQIRKSDSAAADLLSFISCIEPKAIPRSILPNLGSEEQLVHTIGTLRGYAFIVRRGDDEMFDMHNLVHLASRIWIQREGLVTQTIKKATCHLAEAFPSSDYENRSLWREYLPHAFRVLYSDERVDINERYELSLWAGRCLVVDGRNKEAVRCYKECHEWRKSQFPEGHPDRLSSQHELAGAYIDNEQVKEAIELLEHVVAIRETTLPKEHPSLLASQHVLANAYLANGQLKEAVDLLENIVAIEETTVDKDHPDRLMSQHELGRAYIANEQVKEAIELLEHVVAIRETTLPKEHPSLLASQHVLANAYLANGQLKEAVDLLENIVAIEETTVDKDHPDRLMSQHELGRAYIANEQVKEAIELLEHVVAIRETTLSKEHPSLLASQHVLANAYLANDQLKEAVDLLENIVAIEETTVDKGHPDRLVSQHVLAEAYLDNGRVKEAVELLEHVVAVEETKLGKDSPSRLVSQYELGRAYRANGQVKEAIALLEYVVSIEETTLAEDDPSRIASQNELATAYEANKQLAEHIVQAQEMTLAEDDD